MVACPRRTRGAAGEIGVGGGCGMVVVVRMVLLDKEVEVPESRTSSNSPSRARFKKSCCCLSERPVACAVGLGALCLVCRHTAPRTVFGRRLQERRGA